MERKIKYYDFGKRVYIDLYNRWHFCWYDEFAIEKYGMILIQLHYN